jgi:hypothetical protein
LTRSPVIYGHDPVFENARLQPFADQADDALVADPVFNEADQPFLADRPEGNIIRLPVTKTFRPR